MKRKIDDTLVRWQHDKSRKPLVLIGARQTGKTTSVLSFGATHYDNVVHIDFVKQPLYKTAFEPSIDPTSIITDLEALLRQDIDTGTTLLFLDEIQECDRAIASLKYFCQDMPTLDVIAAGSLLGVHVARNESFPVGYVDLRTMHPMDFEEFCWACNEQRAFELVRTALQAVEPCAVHDRMMDLYLNYLLTGGMPEAVLAHAGGKQLDDIRKIQSDIRTAYIADMAKYIAHTDSAKIIATWESIPNQLAKESGSTKFMWKYVASGANAQRYATAVDWLTAAGLVDRYTQVSAGLRPLKSFEIPASFKLYMADVGLLTSAYDALPQDFGQVDHRTARFRGGVAENYVSQQLRAAELEAYYWGQQSAYEVEFVTCIDGKVVPIEVKSGRRIRSTSAQRFAEKYDCPTIIRISAKNFGRSEQVLSIPLYAACLVPEIRL